MGYVPQHFPAQCELPLTVREVVAIGRTGLAGLFRRLNKSDWKIVDEWLARLGISALAQRGFGEISGGEQRKVMIARAMVQQPRLLLLDEPTANLDMGWRERIVETIQSVYDQTKLAVILVCHELEVLPACCKRVILLDKGRVIATGNPEAVFTDGQVTKLYGSGLSVLHRNGRHAVIPMGGR
jgi:ABC-type Mn2+/Zn2+ transport system ATPase subunit